jgi:3-deoxy-manno-octulosonate cytidylyltransferase (CMP-KDO synthetase)
MTIRRKGLPDHSRVVAIIPARYGSTRFDGKPLVDILGKPMIQRVYEGVSRSRLVGEVIVATDDDRILEAVRSFGGRAVMTSGSHRTGTDRVAEVARRLDSELVVNVQGDEPLINGSIVDKAIRPLLSDSSIPMSSLMTTMWKVEDWLNPNLAKVVVDRRGFALYFSRSPIPFPRDLLKGHSFTNSLAGRKDLPHTVFKHIGVYVYRREFLLKFSRMKTTPLEGSEKLEQLRALENGYRIKLSHVDYEPTCVDVPEDLRKVIRALSGKRPG